MKNCPHRQFHYHVPVAQSRETDEGGAWTMGGDPQEIIAGDFPLPSRQRRET